MSSVRKKSLTSKTKLFSKDIKKKARRPSTQSEINTETNGRTLSASTYGGGLSPSCSIFPVRLRLHSLLKMGFSRAPPTALVPLGFRSQFVAHCFCRGKLPHLPWQLHILVTSSLPLPRRLSRWPDKRRCQSSSTSGDPLSPTFVVSTKVRSIHSSLRSVSSRFREVRSQLELHYRERFLCFLTISNHNPLRDCPP